MYVSDNLDIYIYIYTLPYLTYGSDGFFCKMARMEWGDFKATNKRHRRSCLRFFYSLLSWLHTHGDNKWVIFFTSFAIEWLPYLIYAPLRSHECLKSEWESTVSFCREWRVEMELYRLETGRCLIRVRTRLVCYQSGLSKTAFGWCGAVDGWGEVRWRGFRGWRWDV